jgi:hypothetical protein
MRPPILLIAIVFCLAGCSSSSTIEGKVNLFNADGQRPDKVAQVRVSAYRAGDVRKRVEDLRPMFDEIDKCLTFSPAPECEKYEAPSIDEIVENLFNSEITPIASTVTKDDGSYKLEIPQDVDTFLYARHIFDGTGPTKNGVAWIIKLTPGTAKMNLESGNHIPNIVGIRSSLLR